MYARNMSGFVAFIASASLFSAAAAHAQDQGIPDIAGTWYQGAPIPLLPGETAPPAMGMGMGMGMGVSASALQLTDEAQQRMASFDPADDPAVRCEHPGLVRVLLSPYPMQIEQYPDQVILRYEEWAQERTIPIGTEQSPMAEPSPMGNSIAGYEDGRLVIQTDRLSGGLAMIPEFFWMSDRLTTTEQIYLNARGQLVTDLVVTDPANLTVPWEVRSTRNPYDGELLDFECLLRER